MYPVVFRKVFLTVVAAVAIVTFQNCGSRDFVFQKDMGSNISFVDSTPQDEQLVLGKTLFANNCASCHNGPDHYVMGRSSKEDRTAAQISDAINSIPTMSGLSFLRALTSSQLETIAVYLKTVQNDPSTPVACRTNFNPERSPIRLLSSTEYDNIAADVFKSRKKPSLEARFVMNANGTNGFSNTSVTSEPTSPTISALTVEKYLTAANIIADEVIANKAEQQSAYMTMALCAYGATTITDECYSSIVRGATLKVWRRPVSETISNNEFARLKAILKTGTFDEGFKSFIKALLMSPHFLTVSFVPQNAVAAGTSFNLDQYQLATRLAFFLWESSPDDVLLSAARSGALASEAVLRDQVLRMIRDAKGKRFAARLANEWLDVDGLQNLGITSIPSTTLTAMMAETQYMFENIMLNDSSFLDTLSADYSYMNKALADFYGVSFTGADPAKFYKTSLASTPRRGVLGHASFLISTAGANDKTHPVIRGKIISTKIGCYEIAPPPPNLDTSQPQSLPPDATPAEMLAIHTQRATCASCHNTLDPYGLPLESFDSRGIWRTNYTQIGNRSIVTSGTLPTGERFNNTSQFLETLASSPSVRSCLVRKVMSAGLARRVASVDDQCIASQISASHMSYNSKFSDLIMNIVTSRQFKMQTTESL